MTIFVKNLLTKDIKVIRYLSKDKLTNCSLIQVFPKYRRNGCASELENFMINHFIKKELIPFCQVEEGNEKSMKLQKKLGLKESDKVVYWLF